MTKARIAIPKSKIKEPGADGFVILANQWKKGKVVNLYHDRYLTSLSALTSGT